MQIMITHGSLASSRVLQFSRPQLVASAIGLIALLMLASALLYHFVFMTGARDGWPIVGQVVKLVGLN